MRLAPKDLDNIIRTFKECFTETDHLWLFGSRVDDAKRGGDIDLYIEATDFDTHRLFNARLKFWGLLQDRLGEQKIDIVLRDPKQDLLIYKVAQEEGISLV